MEDILSLTLGHNILVATFVIARRALSQSFDKCWERWENRVMNTRIPLRGFALVILLALPAWAAACLWDYDTLKQERSRFPGTLELITGKFLRHSPEFYEWRIRDRTERLKIESANLALYDDLAVAHQKTGNTARAIEVMQAKEKIQPGLYETYSNLGTFHILNGDFEKGLPFIDKALAINPNAHFGREKYQKWLVEYAMTTKGFPMQAPREESCPNFRGFLNRKWAHRKSPLDTGDLPEAINAVLGMMRFANHDNPLLLEALGDLLGDADETPPEKDAKRLAARAYLAASAKMPDEAAREKYRSLAKWVLMLQVIKGGGESDDRRLSIIEAEWKQEMDDANRWYAELRDREIAWIAAGVNVDQEFDKLYTTEPTSDSPSVDDPRWEEQKSAMVQLPIALIGGFLGLVALGMSLGKLARLIA